MLLAEITSESILDLLIITGSLSFVHETNSAKKKIVNVDSWFFIMFFVK